MTAFLPPPSLPALAHPPQQGFLEHFRAHCEDAPASPAWINLDTGETTSYRELELLALRIESALREGGIQAGSVVLVLLRDGLELVATFLALASTRAIAVVAADTSTAFELSPLLADTAPRGVVWAGGVLRSDVANLGSLDFALCLSAEGSGVPPKARSATLPSMPSPGARLDAPPPESIISCHATYKGLGIPLGVLHSYRDFSWVIERTMARLDDVRGARCLSAVSHVPIYGLINAALFPLSTGGCVVQLADLNRPDIFELLRLHRVRFAPLVPLLLRLLVGRAEVEQRHGACPESLLPPDARFVVGGSHCEPALLERTAEVLGVRPWQGYGTTETLIISAEHLAATRIGSLGVTDPDAAELRAIDAGGQEVARGALGELYAASVAMFKGYANRPAETERFLHDGWFRTGDLGRVDEAGFVHYEGRRLGFTKVASQMVDLEEVRRAFTSHPEVEDTRAAVHSDRLGLNHLSVAVRLRPGSGVGPMELRAFAATSLSAHKIPRRIAIVSRNGKGPV